MFAAFGLALTLLSDESTRFHLVLNESDRCSDISVFRKVENTVANRTPIRRNVSVREALHLIVECGEVDGLGRPFQHDGPGIWVI